MGIKSSLTKLSHFISTNLQVALRHFPPGLWTLTCEENTLLVLQKVNTRTPPHKPIQTRWQTHARTNKKDSHTPKQTEAHIQINTPMQTHANKRTDPNTLKHTQQSKYKTQTYETKQAQTRNTKLQNPTRTLYRSARNHAPLRRPLSPRATVNTFPGSYPKEETLRLAASRKRALRPFITPLMVIEERVRGI